MIGKETSHGLIIVQQSQPKYIDKVDDCSLEVPGSSLHLSSKVMDHTLFVLIQRVLLRAGDSLRRKWFAIVD